MVNGELITSTGNTLVRQVAALQTKKGRQEAQWIAVEGFHGIESALSVALKPVHCFYLNQSLSTRDQLQTLFSAMVLTPVADKVMAKMASTDSPPPVLAVFEQPTFQSNTLLSDPNAKLLYLDGLQDPGNVGTLLRSAVAFGMTGVLFGPGCVDAWNPKVIRSSAGMVFHLPIVEVADEVLASSPNNITRWVTTGSPTAMSYKQVQFNPPFILMLGNEGAGLRPQWLNHAEVTAVTIPMADGVESLNVAVSGSILMSHIYQHLMLKAEVPNE